MTIEQFVRRAARLFTFLWFAVGGRRLDGFVNWLRNMPRKSPME